MIGWRGRVPTCEQQVANACDSFVDLTPSSDVPAAIVAANWAAWLPGQTVPLIWERTYGEAECDGCPYT